jgi:hypothetical protein
VIGVRIRPLHPGSKGYVISPGAGSVTPPRHGGRASTWLPEAPLRYRLKSRGGCLSVRSRSVRLMRRSIHPLDGSLDVSPVVLDRLDV